MSKKTAVLVDLGFAIKKLQKILKRMPTAVEVRAFAVKCIEPDEELFRIYCYHCEPFDGTATHPLTGTTIDFSKTGVCAINSKLIAELKLSDNIAFRSGQLSVQGWMLKKYSMQDILKTKRAFVASDFSPDLKQKGVDIKIGLDVAWLANKRIIERIVLITADSDFIEPMKFARREGVQIILVTMGHKQVKKELKEHADILRDVVFP